MKKVLVIGGTGTMGRYLCPILSEMGYEVHAIAAEIVKNPKGVRYFLADAMDDTVLEEFLKRGYDAVVDFMWYHDVTKYESRYQLFLQYTEHYIALSSYRVYANSNLPLTESSPRLAETLDAADPWQNATGYAQSKCRIEDLLHSSPIKNWTILRPTVVYCPGRMPLVSFSKNEVALCAYANKKIVLPKEALDIKTTMIWGEDAARMIAKLLFNPKAKGEIYNIASGETMTWGEVLDCYKELYGLQAHLCNTDEFFRLICGKNATQKSINQMKFILYYDRLYNRIVDNTKVLQATGLTQSDLTPIRKGLAQAVEGIIPQNCIEMEQFLRGEGQ